MNMMSIKIKPAILVNCSDPNQEYCTWGDGDSLDRERVRDILLDEFGYTHKEGTW